MAPKKKLIIKFFFKKRNPRISQQFLEDCSFETRLDVFKIKIKKTLKEKIILPSLNFSKNKLFVLNVVRKGKLNTLD